MKKLNFKGRAKQAGFTLIELIVVIVILGIMAATALPKFMDLGADARLAKAQSAYAAVKSTLAMAEGASKTQNKLNATLSGYTLQGGAPKASDIMEMAGVAADYADIDEATPVTTAVFVATDSEHPTCGFSYTEAVVVAATGTDPETLTTAAALDATPPVLADCQ